MSDVTGTSRRKFIGTAGAAAAAVGVAGAIPGFASTGSSTSVLTESVVVGVVDAGKGVFKVMYGEKEVQVIDQAFAGRIAAAIA